MALRVQARLPLDDVNPHLKRSALHRCLPWRGISRLPKADRQKPKSWQIGYFHIDIAELCHEGGKAAIARAMDGKTRHVLLWRSRNRGLSSWTGPAPDQGRE